MDWDPRGGPATLVALLAGAGFAIGCLSAPPPGLDDGERKARLEEMWQDVRRVVPEVPTVTAEELLASGEPSEVVFLDARKPEERAVSTLPGAITREELEADPERFRGREIVTYCTIGHRSAYTTRELRAEGWDARNLAGSILAWTHAGGILVDPEGRPTRRIHVYGKKWNLAPRDYEAVW